MTPSTPPTILIIDDDAAIGRSLKRLAEHAFGGYQVMWARNAVTGLDLVRQYADGLRLIVLDIKMPLLDGTLAVAQIRQLAPQVPVMPFTSHEESLPMLIEMGCVQPLLKRPESIAEMPALMRRAMTATIAPLPDSAWVRALQQSGNAVLTFVQQETFAGMLTMDQQAATNVQRAVALLDKYCRRIGTPPAREIQLARKALGEVA